MIKPSIDFFHTIFIVPDLKRSLEFFRDQLDFNAILEAYNFELQPGSGKLLNIVVVERNDDVHGMLELVQMPQAILESTKSRTKPDIPKTIKYDMGFWAVVFQVKDLKAIYKEWKAKGINFVNEPNYQTVPGQVTNWSVLLRDIDGNLIELVEPVEFL